MEIHNTNEDTVKDLIEEYCNSDSFDREKFCCCIQCKLDVACYVLNNTKPRYFISSRGIVHHELNYVNKLQETADFYRLVKEGFSIIANRKRPGIEHSLKTADMERKGIFYNFPNIMGKIIDGKTFEPVSNAEVILYLDDKIVCMTSKITSNPNVTTDTTKGIFIFWPCPVETDKIGTTKSFRFRIVASHPGFDKYIRLIDIDSTAEDSYRDSIHMQNTLNIDDIYLFPKVE